MKNKDNYVTYLYPMSVAIETSTICNHSCRYCPISIYPPSIKKVMDIDIFTVLLNKLKISNMCFKRISYNHYNEPLLDPLLIQRLILTYNSGLFQYVLINTNLAVKTFDFSKIERFKHFIKFNVNLPTLIPQRYTQLHGKDDLNFVVSNIDYLIEHDFNIRINLQKNRFTNLFDEQSVFNYFTKKAKINIEKSLSRGGLLKGFTTINENQKSALLGCSINRPLKYIHIDINGNVFFCCQDYFKKFQVGSLLKMGLNEILFGQIMQNYLDFLYRNKKAPHSFLCNNCEYSI